LPVDCIESIFNGKIAAFVEIKVATFKGFHHTAIDCIKLISSPRVIQGFGGCFRLRYHRVAAVQGNEQFMK
jgi:hypothetical protein